MGKFISLNSYRLNEKKHEISPNTKSVKKEEGPINTFEAIIKKLIDEENTDYDFEQKQLKNAEKAFAHILKIEYIENIKKNKAANQEAIAQLNEYFKNRNLQNLKKLHAHFDENYSDTLPQHESLHIKYLKDKPKLQFENCTLYEKTIECLDKLRGL